jgi:hypothetical protein
MTVIFPNNDIFLRDQSFKSLLILSILDMQLSTSIYLSYLTNDIEYLTT